MASVIRGQGSTSCPTYGYADNSCCISLCNGKDCGTQHCFVNLAPNNPMDHGYLCQCVEKMDRAGSPTLKATPYPTSYSLNTGAELSEWNMEMMIILYAGVFIVSNTLGGLLALYCGVFPKLWELESGIPPDKRILESEKCGAICWTLFLGGFGVAIANCYIRVNIQRNLDSVNFQITNKL